MKEATHEEFMKALGKAKWPRPEYVFSNRVTDVYFKDRGVEVAHKTKLLKRGKVVQETLYVNEDYLK